MNRVEASNRNVGGSIQKLQLFMRGNAMSGAPIIIGISQLARPTKEGMIAPNTMTRPCSVVIWLKNSGSTSCMPGWNSSARMIMAKVPPRMNMQNENHRYIVPMSLWFVVNNHRPRPLAGPWSTGPIAIALPFSAGNAGGTPSPLGWWQEAQALA
jgi:hypothetical protein